MSPEQATAQSAIDGRSDVYSLGCVVFEMLTGETPYTGRSADVISRKKLGMPGPHVTTVRETIPAAVDDAIRRALARVPADRYRLTRDYADFIQNFIEIRDPRIRQNLAPWRSPCRAYWVC